MDDNDVGGVMCVNDIVVVVPSLSFVVHGALLHATFEAMITSNHTNLLCCIQ